jgi:hypothetical protein
MNQQIKVLFKADNPISQFWSNPSKVPVISDLPDVPSCHHKKLHKTVMVQNFRFQFKLRFVKQNKKAYIFKLSNEFWPITIVGTKLVFFVVVIQVAI